MGNAIREIRDSRLYRETHDTFGAYCRERWGWSKSHANRQVEAANTAEILTPIGAAPGNEAQARDLTPLAKEDPEAAQELMADLVAQHGERLTAKDVKTAVKAREKRPGASVVEVYGQP